MTEHHPYGRLTPDTVLDAVESQGYLSDARIAPLNSYENRVYQVDIEDGEPLIAKFYRPQRWTAEQIVEEHNFSLELAALDIPVVAPLRNAQGDTLFGHDGFMFALYPRRGGRAPDLENDDDLEVLGRLMGRLHAVGEQSKFQHRPELTVASFGEESIEYLLAGEAIPSAVRASYEAVARPLLARVEERMEAVDY